MSVSKIGHWLLKISTDSVVTVTRFWGKKLPKCFHKLPKKYPQRFLHELIFFKIAQKSTIFLGYFCKQICCRELSKIAQSGHTVCCLKWVLQTNRLARQWSCQKCCQNTISCKILFFPGPSEWPNGYNLIQYLVIYNNKNMPIFLLN